jgi:coenzyme PQQ precursor peptide PqqA
LTRSLARPIEGEGRVQSEAQQGVLRMSWKAPKVVEIALGAEINSYACAEAKK